MFSKKTVMAITAATAAVAGGLAFGVPQATASGAATPTCREAGLEVTLDDLGTPQAGMNHSGTYLRMKNTTDRTCAVRGYPGLGLEKAGHEQAPTDTDRGSTYFAQDPGRKTVYLQPGDSAWADLEWTHTGANDVKAKSLRVTPPAATTQARVPLDEKVDNGRLAVTALSDTPPGSPAG
ncbi:DUF4232 domain-containing protein [Streptomyces sp. NPDC047108]|uniref:DUF4232 domain-containing protein n=1 Tax=Streptomyces sp. NPDC047108 TaxID=3155025 RepID=UPI0033D36837